MSSEVGRDTTYVFVRRTEHEALLAAARTWIDENWDIVRSADKSEIQCQCSFCQTRHAIYMALRAAGIEHKP